MTCFALHANQLLLETLYDSNICHVVSGHIDVHSDRKRFDSITYAETPNFDKTVNYSLGVFFSKMGSKIQIAHTLLICASIYHLVV